MVGLGLSQKPVVMPRYPHMMREDTEVWTKFLASGFGDIKEVWYDVKIGNPVYVAPDATEMERKIAAGLTRKRIDVVAAVGGGIWVIEVKPCANMYAVGQVLTYTRLFKLTYISPGVVVPVIICHDFDEDLEDEFDEFGVLVIEGN